MKWLALGVAAYATLIVFTSRGCLSKILAVMIAPVVIFLMKGPSFMLFGVPFPIEAKVWGVVADGGSHPDFLPRSHGWIKVLLNQYVIKVPCRAGH